MNGVAEFCQAETLVLPVSGCRGSKSMDSIGRLLKGRLLGPMRRRSPAEAGDSGSLC